MIKYLFYFSFLLTSLSASAQVKLLPAEEHWVGTWATAPQNVVKSYMPYNNNMTNRSVRQVVKVSIGGTAIRLKLTNELSTEPLEIRSVYIATALDSCDIVEKSAKYLQFGKKYKVTIPAGKAVWSDALKFNLKPLQRVAITINYTKAPANPTVHMGSRTTTYILRGVTNAQTSFKTAFRENHWFNIDAIEVNSALDKAIAIIGNSITDGKGSTDNAQNRWPDMMSEVLNNPSPSPTQPAASPHGVLNLGIGNNRIALTGGFGKPAINRFQRDIMEQHGVEKVVIFEGINDIGAARGNSEQVAEKIIQAIKQMTKIAQNAKKKVYLGTITPFKGAGYYSRFHEAARLYVNDWIRSQAKNVDGILDFDELLRDPKDNEQLQKSLQSDWLHPNATGYKLMGEYAARILR